MPQFNPHNYMNPNAELRRYNGEYYMYTPTKTQDMGWGAVGVGGTVEKVDPFALGYRQVDLNNTYNATIDPTTWVSNAKYTQDDFSKGIQSAFTGFDKDNTTGWKDQTNNLIQQASDLYAKDPTRGDKVFGDVWNNFRNSNLPKIQQLQAQNNPSRPEFTSQSQAQTYAQTGQMTNQQQRDQMARNGSQQSVQPAYTGPTTTRLNMQTGLLEKVPASSVVADQLPMTVSKTITPDQLTNTTNTSGLFPTIANGSVGTQTALNVGEIGLSALDRALLQFNVRQQESAAEQRTQAETALAQAQQGLANVYNTNRESEITRIMQEAGIKEKQAALSDWKVKMAQAQEALNLGLQQENGRIAPMSIIGRRQSLLVEQAQGKIGALAAIANVYADDLDQAWNVANLTIDAMNQDRQERIDAYQFLITASENKIVNLKAEEKEAANAQIAVLKEAQAKAEENKDKVMQLISENTVEAQKAKVSLTDSYEQAWSKMQPFIAAKQKMVDDLQLDSAKLDMQYKKAQIANIYDEMVNRGVDEDGIKIIKINGTDYVQNKDGSFSMPVLPEVVTEMQTTKVNEIVSLIQELKNDPGLTKAVGPISSLLPALSGAKADFKVKFNNLIAKIAKDDLGLLKGPMSDKDIQFIKEQASALSLGMSEAGLKSELDKLEKKFTEIHGKATSSNLGGVSEKIKDAQSNGYQPSEIINYLSSDPAVSDKINNAKNSGYSDQQIIDYLQGFNQPLSVGNSAQKIAAAIKQVESGGNYQIKGGSGENGAYQFMPATWKAWAKQYLGDANAAMTPANQDKVAVAKINDLLKQGYGPKEIALIWNGGEPKVKKGVNKYGVAYDSGAYANKVLSVFNKLS